MVPCYNTQMPCLSDGDVPPPHSAAPFRYQHLLSYWQTGRRLILWAKQQARRNRADHAEVRRNCFFLSAPQAARPYRLGQTVAHQVTKRLGDSRNNGFSYAAVGIPGPASPAWSRAPRVLEKACDETRQHSLAVACFLRFPWSCARRRLGIYARRFSARLANRAAGPCHSNKRLSCAASYTFDTRC